MQKVQLTKENDNTVFVGDVDVSKGVYHIGEYTFYVGIINGKYRSIDPENAITEFSGFDTLRELMMCNLDCQFFTLDNRRIVTEKVLTVDDLKDTDHVGFVLSDGDKGQCVGIMDEGFFPLRCGNTDTRKTTPCSTFMQMKSSRLNRCMPLKKGEFTAYVIELYKFENAKALYKWLSE